MVLIKVKGFLICVSCLAEESLEPPRSLAATSLSAPQELLSMKFCTLRGHTSLLTTWFVRLHEHMGLEKTWGHSAEKIVKI